MNASSNLDIYKEKNKITALKYIMCHEDYKCLNINKKIEDKFDYLKGYNLI